MYVVTGHAKVTREQYSCMNREIFHYPACPGWGLELRWIVKQSQPFLFYIPSPLISLVSLHRFAMRVSTADGSLNCRIKRSLRLFLDFTFSSQLQRSTRYCRSCFSEMSEREEEGGGGIWRMVCRIKQVRADEFSRGKRKSPRFTISRWHHLYRVPVLSLSLRGNDQSSFVVISEISRTIHVSRVI